MDFIFAKCQALAKQVPNEISFELFDFFKVKFPAQISVFYEEDFNRFSIEFHITSIFDQNRWTFDEISLIALSSETNETEFKTKVVSCENRVVVSCPVC